MLEVIVLAICILLFGTGTFFKRLGLIELHPYRFLLITGICYFLFTPIWWWLGQSIQTPVTKTGLVYAIASAVFSLLAGFLLAWLLRSSNAPSLIIVMVNLSSIITLVMSLVFLHEDLSRNQVIAILLAVVSLILMR